MLASWSGTVGIDESASDEQDLRAVGLLDEVSSADDAQCRAAPSATATGWAWFPRRILTVQPMRGCPSGHGRGADEMVAIPS
jgi:hypothetical protein